VPRRAGGDDWLEFLFGAAKTSLLLPAIVYRCTTTYMAASNLDQSGAALEWRNRSKAKGFGAVAPAALGEKRQGLAPSARAA